jgi:hypothetical protein
MLWGRQAQCPQKGDLAADRPIPRFSQDVDMSKHKRLALNTWHAGVVPTQRVPQKGSR